MPYTKITNLSKVTNVSLKKNKRMAKKVAVVAVNPVNGMGLFQYLETFYEHKIPCTLFAVAETTQIKTNSGVALTATG